jgi:hypothetical protein
MLPAYILQQDEKRDANCDFVRMRECLGLHNMSHGTEENHEQRTQISSNRAPNLRNMKLRPDDSAQTFGPQQRPKCDDSKGRWVLRQI